MSVFLVKKWPKIAKKGRKKATLYTNVANFTSVPPYQFEHNFVQAGKAVSYKAIATSYKNILLRTRLF